MTAWWRRSLGGQIVSLMLVALLAGQAMGFALSWNSRNTALKTAAQSEFISRTATLAEVIETMPDDLRRDVLLASATTSTRFWASPTDPRPEARNWYAGARAYLLEPLSDIVNDQSPPETRLADGGQAEVVRNKAFAGWSSLASPLWTYQTPASVLPFEGQIGMGLAVPLPDGFWLNAVFYKPRQTDAGMVQSLISTFVTAIVLCLFGLISARLIARPLRALTEATEALGRGEPLPARPESGPEDIRNLHVAFNRMQERLHRFVADRTRMLAAIGHDLRTPLTTLRLRVELLPDTDLRDKMIASLDEMHRMTEATLLFAKGEAATEPTRNIELSALLESLCDDLAETGFDVAFIEAGKITFRCRPDAIRRCVRNLVENAVRYAGKATVSVVATAQSVEIRVDDDGPGIPENEMQQVFAPFYRLDRSRNAQTGGVGLGLAIARAIAQQHGGDITLSSNAPGLHVSLVLPRA